MIDAWAKGGVPSEGDVPPRKAPPQPPKKFNDIGGVEKPKGRLTVEQFLQEKRFQKQRAARAKAGGLPKGLWPTSAGDPLPYVERMLRKSTVARLDKSLEKWLTYGAA